MTVSFLTLAAVMDPVAPIGSLRELAARHRWETAEPPSQVSLARLGERHEDPSTTTHRVLWYNTYLIHGFQLTLCNTTILARLAEKAGMDARSAVLGLDLDPLDLIDRMGLSDWDLVNAFDLGLGQLEDAFPSVVDAILSVLTFGQVSIGDILKEIGPSDIVKKFSLGVEEIMDKVGLDPVAILVAFCEQALGFLSNILHLPLNGTMHAMGAAPYRPQRAAEIGTMVGKGYHVAALCEVFESDRQKDVEANAAQSGGAVGVAHGPGAGGDFASSGLMTLAFGGRLLTSDRIEFGYQGDRLRDADAWSRKGALRSVLDLGHGRRVELYSTHLFNGGGVLEVDPTSSFYGSLSLLFPPISGEERLAIQLQQIDEVVAFIAATHRPDHVAILVGDLNINANDPAAYGQLMERIRSVDLVDLWPFWVQRGPGLVKPKPRGDTTHPDTVCDKPGAAFCGEPNQPGKSERIDFVFVERPKASHGFVLDITRIRRRPFSRASSNQPHLSDHLGLDFQLIASSRSHVPA